MFPLAIDPYSNHRNFLTRFFKKVRKKTHITKPPVPGFWSKNSGYAEDIASVFRSKQFCNPFSYTCKISSLLFNIRL